MLKWSECLQNTLQLFLGFLIPFVSMLFLPFSFCRCTIFSLAENLFINIFEFNFSVMLLLREQSLKYCRSSVLWIQIFCSLNVCSTKESMQFHKKSSVRRYYQLTGRALFWTHVSAPVYVSLIKREYCVVGRVRLLCLGLVNTSSKELRIVHFALAVWWTCRVRIHKTS